MREIYFDGWFGGVGTARYKIINQKLEGAHRRVATVFVTQKVGDGVSLINSDHGRYVVINKILEHELKGVRISDIRFVYQFQTDQEEQKYGICWEFFLDINCEEMPHWRAPRFSLLRLWDWIRGAEVHYCWHSSDAIAGKVSVTTDFDSRKGVSVVDVIELHNKCDPCDPNAPPTLGLGLRSGLNQLSNPT